MVRSSYEQKPYRKIIMETWGGEVVPSPIDDPSSPGSLGLAISDAVRDAAEPQGQPLLARFGAEPRPAAPDRHRPRSPRAARARGRGPAGRRHRAPVVVAPTSPASRCPFLTDAEVRLVAVEPASCPTLTEGRFDYDFGDTAGMTPLLPMYSLGHDFMPPTIHAGGLRYHGDAPIISNLVKAGRMEAIAYQQGKTFEAAVHVREHGGQDPGARDRARDPGRDRRGAGGEGDRRGEGDPVQLLRPRPPRPRRVRRLPPRPPDRRLNTRRGSGSSKRTDAREAEAVVIVAPVAALSAWSVVTRCASPHAGLHHAPVPCAAYAE